MGNRMVNRRDDSSQEAIAATGLTKSFGSGNGSVTAVAGVDLSIARGEIFGFLGPNGSGKTTLLRILCGLLPPDSGTGHCLDIAFSAPAHIARMRQRRVGYLAQRFTLYDELTVAENLQFRARIFTVAQPGKCVSHALDQYGLRARRNQLAGQLSGGWRRRLELAACLLHQPDLLLLDEPTAGVDADTRSDFWREIGSLANDGITVLVSTHDIAEAERCDRIGYLSRGRIVVSGAPADLVSRANSAVWWLSGASATALTATELAALPGIVHTENRGDRLRVIAHNREETRSALNAFALRHGLAANAASPRLDDALALLLPNNGSGDEH